MINNETHLLYSVLCYEEGHCRRTQHILKVYALAKLFGEQEKISVEEIVEKSRNLIVEWKKKK